MKIFIYFIDGIIYLHVNELFRYGLQTWKESTFILTSKQNAQPSSTGSNQQTPTDAVTLYVCIYNIYFYYYFK